MMVGLMIIGVYSSHSKRRRTTNYVPMADVMVGYPGASPTEVESRVAKPLEKIISNIKVEHIHTMAMNGQALIVQFYEDVERSYVKLYDELAKHEDMFPKGVYNLW
jgi:multidrug efflux pump subunit AcrB